jgi:hypothetical protein
VQPPCLSRSLELLNLVEQGFQVLHQKAEAQPNAVLCRQAKDIVEDCSKETLLCALAEKIVWAQEKRRWLEEKLPAVEKPLQRLEDFVRKGKRPLTNPSNQDDLIRRIKALELVDSCHPKVKEYGELLRFVSPQKYAELFKLVEG